MAKLGKVIGILITGFLIISSFYQIVGSKAQVEKYIIEVDCPSGYVYPDDETKFIWFLKNNDKIFSAEFIPNATERFRHTFQPESKILYPGENGDIIHIFNSTDILSGTHYWLSVSWVIKYYGPLGTFRYQEQTNMDISIYISVNQTNVDYNKNITKDYDDYRNSSNNSFTYILLLPLILIPVATVIFKKYKKEKYYDDY